MYLLLGQIVASTRALFQNDASAHMFIELHDRTSVISLFNEVSTSSLKLLPVCLTIQCYCRHLGDPGVLNQIMYLVLGMLMLAKADMDFCLRKMELS